MYMYTYIYIYIHKNGRAKAIGHQSGKANRAQSGIWANRTFDVTSEPIGNLSNRAQETSSNDLSKFANVPKKSNRVKWLIGQIAAIPLKTSLDIGAIRKKRPIGNEDQSGKKPNARLCSNPDWKKMPDWPPIGQTHFCQIGISNRGQSDNQEPDWTSRARLLSLGQKLKTCK